MKKGILEVDPKTAKTWLDNKEAILIDVREPSEYEAARIAEAILIPLRSITFEKLPSLQLGQKIIVHCGIGARSARAIETLQEEHPELPLYNLIGGIHQWMRLGLPVIQDSED
jgi:rhodanese-related sulfurtransferase